MPGSDPIVRVFAMVAATAVVAWACIATGAWQHAEIECFWALRDLKDQRRDVDALTAEVRELRARLRSAQDWNGILLRCHRDGVDQILAMTKVGRPLTAPLFHHYPCAALE